MVEGFLNGNLSVSEENQSSSAAVLVLNWNGRSLLEACLPPLLNQTYGNYKVVLVDNGSSDDSVQWLQKNFPQVQLIQNSENLGFSRGVNAGLRQVSADVLVLLNNDVLVQPGWLAGLMRPFSQDPTIGIVGAKLLFPDHTIQHLGAELSYPLARSHHFHYREADSNQVTSIRDVPYVTGASLAVKRGVLDKIGLLDEAFHPFYFEEVDFCTRARAAGFRIVVTPEAVAVHDESATMETVGGLKLKAFHQNRLRYVLKHYTHHQFLADFVPAEAAHLSQHSALSELNTLRLVYFETAVLHPTVSATTPGADKQTTAVQLALLQLRQTAIDATARIIPPPPALTEFEFPGDGSFMAALAAKLRRAWSSMAAKWLVRNLMQQQHVHNHYLKQQIEQLRRETEIQASETDRLLTELLPAQQKVQGLAAEVTHLEQRLSQLESQVKRPS